MKYVLLFALLLVACHAPDPPAPMGMGVGPDPQNTGLGSVVNGVTQMASFACDAGQTVVFDGGGYPTCLAYGGGGSGLPTPGAVGNTIVSLDGSTFAASAPFAGGYANATAIGTIPVWQLSLDMTAADQSTGIVYTLTSLTAGGTGCTAPCANGTWASTSYPQSGSFSPGVATVCTSNVSLSGGEVTCNGVTTSASRILVEGQSTTSQNGLYVTAPTGAWSYTSDGNLAADYPLGKQVPVQGGSQAGTIYIVNAQPATLGTNPLTFIANSASGSSFNPSTPGPIGNVTASTVAATTLSTDSGVTSCASSNAPVQDSCGWVTLSSAAWTTVYPQAVPPPNSYETWNTKITVGETTTGGNVTGNHFDAFITMTAFTLVDGGSYLIPQGGASTPTKVALLASVSGTGCAGCSYGTGCTCGATTTLFAYEAIVDGGVIQLQVQQPYYDAGSIYYARASVDTPELLP